VARRGHRKHITRLEEEIGREDFRAAWLEIARLYLFDPEARCRFGAYQPIRADAGAWGFLEVRRIDPGPEFRAEIEQAERKAEHLDGMPDDGKPHFEWGR
jgi:hypothetical protein